MSEHAAPTRALPTPSAKDTMSLSRTSRRHAATHQRLLTAALTALAAITFGASALATTARAEGCPNAALRVENDSTSLPQCRAYEMVTPPYKEGFAAFPQTYSDNGALAYSSPGSFSGDELGGLFNQYVATRSPTGWTTTAYGPPRSEFAVLGHRGAEALSSDLRASVWLARLPGQPSNVLDYYLRAPGGAFERVGPVDDEASLPPSPPSSVLTGGVPPAEFVAGSADLSHILFRFTDAAPILEYVGTGHHELPEAVSVDNARHEPPGGTCPEGISTDGRVVFFAPSCAHIWARINGTASVDVSASQCTRTSGDPGGACNALAPANFAAAAADGSRVFFTTTQQLVNGDTDQTNDLYACDIPPGVPAPVGLGNPCTSLSEASGAASGANVDSVLRVSEDGSRVYFIASGVLAANLGAKDLPAVVGAHNIYVWQKDAAHPSGQTTFVATLETNDIFRAQTTADGRYFLFSTATPLVSSGPNADTDTNTDLYRYDADTGSLLRLSTDTDGTGGNEPGFEATTITADTTNARPLTMMSADGETIVFQTAEALSPADQDRITDVYEWHDGQVSQISDSGASSAWIDASGEDIYFQAGSKVSVGDGDTSVDVYDARIDGGFPVPVSPSCSGEGCRAGLAVPQPAPAAAGSATFNTAASPPPPETPLVETKQRALTRAQKLTKALKACRAKHNRRKRAACERQARRTYGRSK